MKESYPKRFEVHIVNPKPTIGAEVDKIRPCVIVSPNDLNKNLQTVIIAPMTTKHRPWAFRIGVVHDGKKGQIMLDQIRAVSKKRLKKHQGNINSTVASKVLSLLKEMFLD